MGKMEKYLSQRNRNTFYFISDGTKIKSQPVDGKITFYAKEKGEPEYEVAADSNLVAEAIAEMNEITEDQYKE